jgi:hypothetical protein
LPRVSFSRGVPREEVTRREGSVAYSVVISALRGDALAGQQGLAGGRWHRARRVRAIIAGRPIHDRRKPLPRAARRARRQFRQPRGATRNPTVRSASFAHAWNIGVFMSRIQCRIGSCNVRQRSGRKRKTMRTSVFTLASLTTVSGILVVAACSAPAPSNDLRDNDQTIVPPASSGKKGTGNGSSSGSSGSSGTSGGSSSSSSSSSSGGGDGGAAGNCAQTANQEECFVCCEQANPKGLDVIKAADATLGQCLCDNGGACATECAQTACANKEPTKGDACDTCLGGEKSKACFDTFDQTCKGNADCQALIKCDEDNKCETKPEK